ncbi:MAG: hypothetical protein IAE81_23070 [Caldilineaceae bacterium]|jgi:hypothetical protein|nr:hypothetical protein [Caldilineaceae bacterium]
MNAHQVRRWLAFARRADTKVALGWWSLTVYNWRRSHSSLRQELAEPMGKKSTNNGRRPWLWDWPIAFFQSETLPSTLSTQPAVCDNLTALPKIYIRELLKRDELLDRFPHLLVSNI